MIKEITFVVEEIGEFVICKSKYSFVYLNNDDLNYWCCDSADDFCSMKASGFREDFMETTGLRISEQEATEIWEMIIMQYGFLK